MPDRLASYVKFSDYHPLVEIEGQEVMITKADVELVKENDKTKYHSIIWVDGTPYSCWSTFVGKTLMEVPSWDEPLAAKFSKTMKGSKTYWTIE